MIEVLRRMISCLLEVVRRIGESVFLKVSTSEVEFCSSQHRWRQREGTHGVLVELEYQSAILSAKGEK